MSDNQWAGIMLGDESYAGSKNYYHFEESIKSIFGYRQVIPTHQGRMAENLLFWVCVKPGHLVPKNIHFDTTGANVEYKKGIALNLVIDEGLDPHSEHPFKGNMNVSKLEALNEDYLAFRIGQIRYVGNSLAEAGVPIVKPIGGHAVYLNAREFLPHIPQSQFPAQALTVTLYREAGIRAVEIGSLMFARPDLESGEMKYPELELVRLAISRRVHTTMHMN